MAANGRQAIVLGALGGQPLLQLAHGCAQTLGAALLEAGQLGLQVGDPLGQLGPAIVAGQGQLGVLERTAPALGALGGGTLGVGGALLAHTDLLGGRAGGIQAGLLALAQTGVLGEGLLGRLTALRHSGKQPLRLGTLPLGRARLGLGLLQLQAGLTGALPGELEPGLQRLALQALVQLGRLGLALERDAVASGPRARRQGSG